MIDESKAGVRYVDLHMGGSESVVTGMLPEGIFDPVGAAHAAARSQRSQTVVGRPYLGR